MSFTSADYASMKATQAETMNDRCNIYHISTASGTYGTHLVETRTLVSGVPCGFAMIDGTVVDVGGLLLVGYEVILRVADTQPIGIADEVVLIEKGEFMVSGTFKPAAYPIVNSTVQHVKLKRVVS